MDRAACLPHRLPTTLIVFSNPKSLIMPHRAVVLSAPVRTAIGTFGGSLKETPATALGATAVRAVMARTKLDHAKIETVVMGNVVQAGNKMNPARQAAILGGLPVETPAMTVNRVCGSGAQAIASAAQEIMLGMVDCALAGGMENMDASALPDVRWTLGVSARQCRGLRQPAEGWPKRRLLRSAFRVAHGGPGQIPSDHARGPGPLGGAVAEAFLGGAGCRQIRRRDRASRVVRSGTSRDFSKRMSTTAPRRRSRASPSCAPPSARMARLPPAMPPGSTAPPRR